MFVYEMRLPKTKLPKGYPYDVFAVQEILKQAGSLSFTAPVTFLSGDNGTGKSTILEAIAVAYSINPEGGSQNFNFATVESHSSLHEQVILVKKGDIPRTKFFLRSETYYNVASELEELGKESSLAHASYGGQPLHTRSHGEGLLSIIENRFGDKGFYLLDEPEAGLATSRQFALLQEIHRLVKGGSQLIIATHSPVIMSYPDAVIYQFSQVGIEKLPLEETIAFKETKLFYDDPKRMLHYLLEE